MANLLNKGIMEILKMVEESKWKQGVILRVTAIAELYQESIFCKSDIYHKKTEIGDEC